MSRIKKAKSQVVVAPSKYKLRDYGNDLSIPTKLINSGFNMARKAIKDWTGFLQTKATKRKRGFTKGYRRIIPKGKQTNTRALKMKVDTRTLDFEEELTYDPSTDTLILSNSEDNMIYFSDAVSSAEFDTMKDDYFEYKITGTRLTFIPPKGGISVTKEDGQLGATYNVSTARTYPLILGQLGNQVKNYLFSQIQFNNPTFTLDPNRNNPQVINIGFQQSFLIPQEYWGFKFMYEDPWPTNYAPQIYFAPLGYGSLTELTQPISLGHLIIQIQVKLVSRDIGQSRMGKMNALPQLSSVKPKANHKLRRINKRINIRWDRIFDPNNCISEDEDEAKEDIDEVKVKEDQEEIKVKV